jgi:hypothetical protein
MKREGIKTKSMVKRTVRKSVIIEDKLGKSTPNIEEQK